MVQSLALSFDSAGVVTRVDTLEVIAGTVSTAITIVSALASCAFLKWVSPGSGWTETHRSIGSRPVVARSAISSVTARVGLTQIRLGEFSTRLEGIASESTRARADGFVVADLTVGALTAHVWIGFTAGVAALELDTSLVLVAVVMSGTLGVTPGESVAQEVRWALAVGTVVASFAKGVLSANSVPADRHALEVLALFALRALVGGLALSLALPQRVANVIGQAFADGGLVGSNFALGVDSALFANLRSAEVSTSLEWVPGPSPWASADGNVVPGGAVSAVTA